MFPTMPSLAIAADEVPLIPSTYEEFSGVVERQSSLSERRSTTRFAGRRRCSVHVVLTSAFLVTVLSFIWNGLTLLSLSKRTAVTPFRLTASAALRTLRHPSLYPGLERVSEIQAIMRVEHILGQAKAGADVQHPGGAATVGNASAPDEACPTVRPVAGSSWPPASVVRVNAQDPYRWYPQDGWVLLTEQDRAIMEFLPARGNSTTCILIGTFPARRELQHRLLTIEVDNLTMDAPLIQVAALPTSEVMDLARMTWAKRPEVLSDLGTLNAVFGTNMQTQPFACSPGQRVLVELSCLGRGCRLEYRWQDEDSLPRLGIELSQI